MIDREMVEEENKDEKISACYVLSYVFKISLYFTDVNTFYILQLLFYNYVNFFYILILFILEYGTDYNLRFFKHLDKSVL